MSQSILEDLNQLDLQIYRSIEAHPALFSLEDVEFHTTEKHIHIRGKVGSFFEKQLAQETIRAFDQQRDIQNDLQVS